MFNKKIEHGTKEESICPYCNKVLNCRMAYSLMRTGNYLKKCSAYKRSNSGWSVYAIQGQEDTHSIWENHEEK